MHRRRAIALLFLLAVIAAAVLGLSRGSDDTAPAARPLASATATPAATPAPAEPPLARTVGQLVILRFAGPRLPAYAARALGEGRAAGVVLFGDNVVDRPQLRALTRSVRRASGGRALVMADQEGGTVRIVPWAGPARAASAQASAGAVRADSRAAARELRAAGVDVALAPVADVATVPGAALAGRAFSTDAAQAADAVAEAVAGFRAGGVAPTVKHFPGLGAATQNTDDAPVDIASPPVLEPFRAAIAAQTPLVMVSHARYTTLDPTRIASQSRAVVDGLLRGTLGFRGVAITDSLEAAASLRTGRVELAAERAVRAGIDVILTTGAGSSLRVYRRLLRTARRSPAFAARVRASAARVAALQRAY